MDIMTALFDKDEVKRRYEFRLREQGRKEKAIETAQQLFTMGLSDEQIARAVNLPVPEVSRMHYARNI